MTLYDMFVYAPLVRHARARSWRMLQRPWPDKEVEPRQADDCQQDREEPLCQAAYTANQCHFFPCHAILTCTGRAHLDLRLPFHHEVRVLWRNVRAWIQHERRSRSDAGKPTDPR